MAFLFLGLDACDYRFAKHYDLFDDVVHLEQDLPQELNQHELAPKLGWWTTYVWPAMLSGQLVHHHTKLDHSIVPDMDKFTKLAWKSFGSYKLIGLPFSIPELNVNTKFFKPGTINRQYIQLELPLLAKEINHGLENYDAVFAVTRILDSIGHGKIGMTQEYYDWMQEDEERIDAMKQRVLSLIENCYLRVKEQLLGQIQWDLIEQYVIVSDHGFQNLGAGSVAAHSKHAVLKTNLGTWDKMTEFISNWIPKLDYKAEQEPEDEHEEVKKHLQALGYI